MANTPYRITANAPVEVFGGSIILINPTDCCTPTVRITTPWGSVEETKITSGQTITFTNENNQSETYAIRSAGAGIQYAVPGSGFSVDTITNVKLYVTYLDTYSVEIKSDPPGAIINVQ